MNFYHGLTDMWADMAQQVFDDGQYLASRDGGCTEIVGWSGKLLDINRNFVINKIRKASPVYASAELLWYLKGDSSTKMMEYYAPQYRRFSNRGEAFGAYGARMYKDANFESAFFQAAHHSLVDFDQNKFFDDHKFRKIKPGEPKYQCPISQLQFAAWLLKTKPETRQCVVSLWNGGDLVWSMTGSYNDIPCTLTLQFLLRQGRLDMVVNMRSNDIWLGTPYDVYCFTMMQKMVADSIGIDYGTYTHNVGSLHIYDRNKDKMLEALDNQTDIRNLSDEHVPRVMDNLRLRLERAIFVEEQIRSGQDIDVVSAARECGNGFLNDAVLCCAMQDGTDYRETLDSPVLDAAMQLKLGAVS